MIGILAAVAITVLPAQASAYSPGYRVNGNTLQDVCSSPDQPAQVACVMYVSGVADQIVLQGVNDGHDLLCMPPEVAGSQMRDLVLANLAKDPKNRHLPASVFVWRALLDAYPCKDAWLHLMPKTPGRP